jgi:hypothetical protein
MRLARRRLLGLSGTRCVRLGTRLDTSPAGSFNAFSYSKSSNGPGFTNTGTATVACASGSCMNYTSAVVRDPGGNWHADALYVHTVSTTTGNVFTIASGAYPQTTSHGLAMRRTSPDARGPATTCTSSLVADGQRG